MKERPTPARHCAAPRAASLFRVTAPADHAITTQAKILPEIRKSPALPPPANLFNVARMSSPVVSFPPPARTILIVDDQPSVLATLAYVFTVHGYSAMVATKGAEALAMAETQAFDAALIDLHMPGLDGVTVCRSLCERLRAQNKNVPVWVMTAAHTKEAAAKSVEAGARDLLKKPFDSATLIQEIETALAQPAPAPAVAPPVSAPAPADEDHAVA